MSQHGGGCKRTYGDDTRCELDDKDGPDNPVTRPGDSVEHVDHSFAGAYGVSRAAHSDPVLEEDAYDDRP